MLRLIDNVVFFPKSLDDLDGLFPPAKEYSVYACRASEQVLQKYSYAYVYEAQTGRRLFSTTKFFRNILSSLDLADTLAKSTGIVTYQAYPWCDDLRNLGYRVCAVPYLLYLALHNKFRQKEMLVDASRNRAPETCKKLEQHFAEKEAVFHTEFRVFDSEDYSRISSRHKDGFVVANSCSDGGSNVFRVLSKKIFDTIIQKLSSPVVRIENYINGSISINQIGIVMDNGWIMKYQPSIQLLNIQNKTGQFEYVGSTYDLGAHGISLEDGRIKKSTELTDYIGNALHSMGYRGIFGCDYLLDNRDTFFVELNPRYQASTRILSMAANRQRELSPHLLHIGAFHSSMNLDIDLLSAFKEADAFIRLIRPEDAKGYIRIWDSYASCDRVMCGNTIVEPQVHVGYNLI